MYCKIFYLLNNEKKEWAIEAHPKKDNKITLKKHLKRWIPEAKFLDYQMGEEPT